MILEIKFMESQDLSIPINEITSLLNVRFP